MKQIAPVEAGIAVEDLDRMHAFYTRALGCHEVRRAEIPAALSSAITLARDGYTCVWLKTPGGETIKLMRPPNKPAASGAPALLTERRGIAYLTFYCDAIGEVLARCEAAGATLRSDRALIQGERPVKLCFLADPEGNVIELVEPQDLASFRPDIAKR
ncbi:MAG: VOC family protein [Deltaproteobacteria bacterium]|nr:VOC family protein [Deltaproteobacteria bacterium]